MDSEQTMKDIAVVCADVVRSADCDKYFLDELSSFPLKGMMLNTITKWIPIPCLAIDSQHLYTKCAASSSGSDIPAANVSFPKDPNFYDMVLLKVKDLLHKLRVSTDDIALSIVFDRLLMYSKQHTMCGPSQVARNHFATFVLTLPNFDQQDLPKDEMISSINAEKNNQFLVHAISNTHPTAALCFNDHTFILQKSSEVGVGLALVFHLLRQDAGCTDIPLMMFSKHNQAAGSSLRRQITNWAVHTRPTDKQQLLIFPLQCMYAIDGLSFGMLKGSDASLWSAMAPQRHFLTYDLALVDDIKGESFVHSIPWINEGKDGERQLKGLNFFPDCECVTTLPHPDSNEENMMMDSDEHDQQSNGLKLHRAVIVVSIRHRFASIEAERRSGTNSVAFCFTTTSSVISSHPMMLSASTTLSSEGGELTPVQSLEQTFDVSLKHLASTVVTRMTDTNGTGLTAATAMDSSFPSSSSRWNGIYVDRGNQPPPPQASSTSSSSSGARFIASAMFGGAYHYSRYSTGMENDDMKKSRSDPQRRLQFLRQRLEQRSIGRARYTMEEGGPQAPPPQQQRAYGAPPAQVYPAPPRLPNRLERQNGGVLGRSGLLSSLPDQDQVRVLLPQQQQQQGWDYNYGIGGYGRMAGWEDREVLRPGRSFRMDRDEDDRVDREEITYRRNMEADEHHDAARLERDRQRHQIREQRRAQIEESRRLRNLERERGRAQQGSQRRQGQLSMNFFGSDDDDNDTIDFNDFMADYDPWESSMNIFAAASSSTAYATMRSNVGVAAQAPAEPSVPAAALPLPTPIAFAIRPRMQEAPSSNQIPMQARPAHLSASMASTNGPPALMDSRIADAHPRVEEARASVRQRVEEARASSQQRAAANQASAQQRAAANQASAQQRAAANQASSQQRLAQARAPSSMSARVSLEELLQMRSSSPFWEIPSFPPPNSFAPNNYYFDVFDDLVPIMSPVPEAIAPTVPAPQATSQAQVSASSAANVSSSLTVNADDELPPSRRKRSLASIVRDSDGTKGEEQQTDLSSSGLRRSRRTRGSQQQG